MYIKQISAKDNEAVPVSIILILLHQINVQK